MLLNLMVCWCIHKDKIPQRSVTERHPIHATRSRRLNNYRDIKKFFLMQSYINKDFFGTKIKRRTEVGHSGFSGNSIAANRIWAKGLLGNNQSSFRKMCKRLNQTKVFLNFSDQTPTSDGDAAAVSIGSWFHFPLQLNFRLVSE